MKGFFKTFFASLFALIIFSILAVFLFLGFIASLSSVERPSIGGNAVLVLDLSSEFKEKADDNPVDALLNGYDNDRPSLFDAVRMIEYAVSDSSVQGLYILCGNNNNGLAASEELRKAVATFKQSGKFVLAYGEAITQKGYYVGSVADKIYCHPQGGVDWSGFSSELTFLKGTLEKLEIEPQIFYAGKYKSATEPFRESKMTDANREQTSVWLGDMYNHFLQTVSNSRSIDTAFLRALAVNGSIQTASDAMKYKLVDGLKYDDDIKNELTDRLDIGKSSRINFVMLSEYAKASSWRKSNGDKIAVVFADGEIVSGSNNEEQVGSDAFRALLRRLRFDNGIKAVVLRVNSPGGSSLASDVIWHEVSLLRKEKPVVVSMGDVAASGGYYIACGADSVFANASTITGSIGVFSILPNMQSFFKNKLGITFDRVKTAPYADMGSPDRPLTEPEKRFFQAAVDSIYHTFKSRVSDGRKKDIEYIDTIAQGRVWTGTRGLQVGLVDRIGTLKDAVASAAKMAGLKENYRVNEYPEKKSFFEQIMGDYKKAIKQDIIKQEIGEEQMALLKHYRQVKQMIGTPQARLPFTISVR